MSAETRKKKVYPVDPEEVKKRGQRVKFLRKLMRYTTQAFSEKCATNESTLKSWEQGRFTGLTTTGALRIIEACKAEGVNCTLEWLLYGRGVEPAAGDISQKILTLTLSVDPIAQELRVFHQLHPDAIDIIVADDTMEPAFSKGDCVAGIRRFEKDIPKLIGKNCIVQLPTGEVLVRTLKAGKTHDLYTLTCVNLKAKEAAQIKNIKLFSAASIIWIRKPES